MSDHMVVVEDPPGWVVIKGRLDWAKIAKQKKLLLTDGVFN